MPMIFQVDIKTQTSSSTGYYPLPHDYFDIGSPTLSVEPQKVCMSVCMWGMCVHVPPLNYSGPCLT